ncbi:MFS transporter [Streptomyces durhamensis]|uniref:MFS transporter n=1 Tax=Streptomyces durhamensis TaxID=68194 RepID=UPI0006910CFC|nr:MFS transporter [Streptomyces durhamensis]
MPFWVAGTRSIALFLRSSLFAGAAPSMTRLIGFRALQGIGAGGPAAGGFALIGVLVPPRKRGRYQGMTASVMALGVVGGPLVGGLVTGHLGWRWAFYVDLPLGIVALAWVQLTLRLPERALKARPRIDWAGIAVLATATGAAVLPGPVRRTPGRPGGSSPSARWPSSVRWCSSPSSGV